MLYVLAAVVYVADQAVKWWIQHHLQIGETIAVWPSVVAISYIRNPGAAWGILDHAHGLLIFIALAVIAGVVWAERKYRPGVWNTVGMALVLGGALGNLTDRVVSGTVVDYVYLRFIQFPVFNLADVAIDVGVAMLLLRTFGVPRKPSPHTKDVTK